MTYAFPPPVPMSIGIPQFVLYVLVLTFALAAILRVFAWYEQIPLASRLRRSWIALGLAAFIGLGGLIHSQTRGRLQEYLGFFTILLYSLAVLTLVRQFRHRPPSIVGVPLALCFAFLLATGISPLPPPFRNLSPPAPWNPECGYRLRNLHIAQMNMASGRIDRLKDTVVEGQGRAPQSWRLDALSYMFKHIPDFPIGGTWDSPEMLEAGRTNTGCYSCPLNLFAKDDLGRYYTDYAAVTGPDTAFPGGRGISLSAISAADGLAYTILLGECSGLNIVWTEPRDINLAEQKIGINLPGNHPRTSSSILSSYHPGGAFVALADGQVRFLSEKIDHKVLQALTTVTGRESVPDDGW